MYNPVHQLDDNTDQPYPSGTQTSGVRLFSTLPGTFVLMPQNSKRVVLCVTRLADSGDVFVRPYELPGDCGFLLNVTNPNLVLDEGTVGPRIRGQWWIQGAGDVNVWVYENVLDSAG